MEPPAIPQTDAEIKRILAEFSSGDTNPVFPATSVDPATIRADMQMVVALAKAHPEKNPSELFGTVSDAPHFSARSVPLRVLLYDWMEGTVDFAALLGNRAIPQCNLARVARTGKWFDFRADLFSYEAFAGMLWNIRGPDNQFIGFEYRPPAHAGDTAILAPWIVFPPSVRPSATMAHLTLSPLPSGFYYLLPESPTVFRAVRHGTDEDCLQFSTLF